MLEIDGYRWSLERLGGLFEPRKPLSVSEWSDAYRVLSGKASAEAGQWRTDRTPYLREILDALSDDCTTQRVVVMKSSQIGCTEAATNWIGYVMDHIRSSKPMMIVLPTDELRKEWVLQRLRPMVQLATPLKELIDVSKSRDGTNTLERIDYPGGLLFLTTAKSAPRLKSKTIRFVICDECDEFGWNTGARGDPMGMIESRTTTFPYQRKILMLSTPTDKGASRIEGEWENSDRRRYHVPCPHCGEQQILEWDHLQWTEDLSRAWYACRHNGCMIEERDKTDMMVAGRWIPEQPQSKVRGYHINALYSPHGLGFTWIQLVRERLHAERDPELLKTFVNERLGLPYEDTQTAIAQDGLRGRAEPYPLRQPPDGCLTLTAGVDTQDNRLAVQVVGWGPGVHTKLQWWVLDYIEIPGSPARDDTWVALAEFINEPLINIHGREIHIDATAIDQGGHFAQEVKAFVKGTRAGRAHRHVIGIIGSNTKLDEVTDQRPRKSEFNWRGRVNRFGAEHWRIDTEKAKKYLFRCLREDQEESPETYQAHFSGALTTDYYHQLLSEVWDPKRNKFIAKRGHNQHEVLDTWVYAYAASYYPRMRLHERSKKKWAELDIIHSRDGPVEKHPGMEKEKKKQQSINIGSSHKGLIR